MYWSYNDEEGLVTQDDKEAYVKRRYGRLVRYKGGRVRSSGRLGKRGAVNQSAAQPTVPGSQDALKQNLGADEVNPTLPPMQHGDTSIAPQWASGSGSAPSNYYGTFGNASVPTPYANAPYWGVIGPGTPPPVDKPWWG